MRTQRQQYKNSHNTAQTSLKALKEKMKDGSIITDKQRCYVIIKEYGPLTQADMEIHMGKNKHKFSGRIRQLKDDELIEVVGTEDGHQLLEIKEQTEIEETEQANEEPDDMDQPLLIDAETGEVIAE